MINILLSTYDFNNRYCFSKIKEYLKPNMKVCIVPFSHHYTYYIKKELFDELYNFDNGKDFNIIANSFKDYGIFKENVYVLNPHKDSIRFMKYKIKQSDILFFTGGDPILYMTRLKSLGLFNTLKDFKGITIGASAGAMIQLKEFFTYDMPWERYPYSYHQGLGYIEGLDVIVHYNPNCQWQNIAKHYNRVERRIPYLNLYDGRCLIFK